MINPMHVALIAGALSLMLSFLLRRRPGSEITCANTSDENLRPLKTGLCLFRHELPAMGLILPLLFSLFFFLSESLWNSIFFIVGSAADLIFTEILMIFFSADLQSKLARNNKRAILRSGSTLGFFTGGFALLTLSGLYWWIPVDEPESWILFAFGVSIVSFIRICLNRLGRSVSPADQTGKSPGGRRLRFFQNASNYAGDKFASSTVRIAVQLSDLYTASILSLCILMAASLFMTEQLPDWGRIAPLLASTGLAASALGIGLSFSLGGICTGLVAAITGTLYSGAAFFILKGAADGITTQGLAEMGMLDRLGPFWSVPTGIFAVLLTHVLFQHYQKADDSKEKNRYLFGKAERIYLSIIFPGVGVWIAYELAGLYGIVLSAAGAAGVLTFLISIDSGEAGSIEARSGRPSFFTALQESSGSVSFFVAAGCLALIPLYAAELGTVVDSGALGILGVVAGFGLGTVHPFAVRKLGNGFYWKNATLPLFTVLAAVLLVGGLLGLPALLGFLAATLCTAAAYWFFDCYREHAEPSVERASANLALAKTAASAALALLPLIVLIYESFH